jgi:hypothetical protein
MPGKSLLRFSGIMEADDADAMTHTIEKGCEQVDINEWQVVSGYQYRHFIFQW